MVDLHSAGHRRGVVCAPHYGAVEAGQAILAEGGNAIEAMLAMAATIAAVYPHMNHIGGDGFWLIRERTGRILAIMAAGPAGLEARPEFYATIGNDSRPADLPRADRAGRGRRLDAGARRRKSKWRKLPPDLLLTPAIAYARDGYTVSPSQAQLTKDKLAELATAPGFAETFLVDGKPPDVGTLLKQTAFAETLSQLAHAGLDDFYRGDVGREIAADLAHIGSPVVREDLARYRAWLAEPLAWNCRCRHHLQHRRADPGHRLADDPRFVRRLGVPNRKVSIMITAWSSRPSGRCALRDRVVTDPAGSPHALSRCLDRVSSPARR